MRILFRLFFLCGAMLGMICHLCAQQLPLVVVTTVMPPVNPFIVQALGSPVNGINVMVRNISNTQFDTVILVGKLQRLSPAGFLMERNQQDLGQQPQQIIGPLQGVSYPSDDLLNAFGSFNDKLLQIDGVTLNDIRDNQTEAIKLPPGQYRVCFTALRLVNDNFIPASAPGCAFFNMCKTDPPQLTRPTSNFSVGTNMTVIPAGTPVNFTWTPPMSACGSPGPVNYELEIREILNNQNVTDALNNPLVFSRAGLPSPAFLLDLNLYPNILYPGKQYVVRVKANNINSIAVTTIDNNGYSRPEAFQFGLESGATPVTSWSPPSYYLSMEERKSGFWRDYEGGGGRDTMMPVAEFIAYRLMQQGVAYNQDAIDLLVALNPGLKEARTVKLKQPVEFPGLPDVADKERMRFDSAFTADKQPDGAGASRFNSYLDSLQQSQNEGKVPARVNEVLGDLIGYLERFEKSAAITDRVSIGYINVYLSELLFDIRHMQNDLSKNAFDHLRELVADLKLLAVIPEGNTSSAMLYQEHGPSVGEGEEAWAAAGRESLASADVIVYRPAPPPSRAIMNAPDLKGVFRVFYTSRALYNNRNPEINAKSPGTLASTVRVSLPGGIRYKFWTLNMINHKQTLAEDVDFTEIMSGMPQPGGKGRKVTIILKVE